MKKILLIIVLSLNVMIVNAHQTSTSFVSLKESSKQTTGLWKISINALNTVMTMDRNNDGYVKWNEIEGQHSALTNLLSKNLEIINKDNNCSVLMPSSKSLKLDSILGMNYIVIPFSTDCLINEIVTITYKFYFEYDNDHKGILNLETNKDSSNIHVFSADIQSIEPKNSTVNSFMGIIYEGVWHIWVGFDHIVFLITLMIGILFIGKTRLANKSHSKITEILKVVTAFTVAHSITLGLAAFQLVSIPVQLIEAAIAVTLVIAALHNIRSSLSNSLNRVLSCSVWKMAFVFGLIHGFGFANVLTELQLSASSITMSLLAFNIGVELGQFVIVLVFVLISTLCINKIQSNYKLLAVIRPISSGVVIILGTVWFVERSFNIVVIY